MKNNIVLEAFVITVLEGIAGGIAQSYSNGSIVFTALGAAFGGVVGVLYFHWDKIVEDFDIVEILKSILLIAVTGSIILFILFKAVQEGAEQKRTEYYIDQAVERVKVEAEQKSKFMEFRTNLISGKNQVSNLGFSIYGGNSDPNFQYIRLKEGYGFFGFTYDNQDNSLCILNKSEYESLIKVLPQRLTLLGGNHYWKMTRSSSDFGYQEDPKLTSVGGCIDYFWNKPFKEIIFVSGNKYAIREDSCLFQILKLDLAMKQIVNK